MRRAHVAERWSARFRGGEKAVHFLSGLELSKENAVYLTPNRTKAAPHYFLAFL
jgi:hypothetical protein